jgi:adenylate cyclase
MPKKLIHALLAASLIALFFSGLFLTGFFGSWQDRASDSQFLSRTPLKAIVIISIDDKSIQAIGRWPWNRSIHADLLEKLGKRPIAIGYDVSFPEVSNASDDARLAHAISQTRKTVLPLEAGLVTVDGKVTSVRRVLQPIEILSNVSDVGIVNTVADGDSITRHIPVYSFADNDQQDEHFSLILARAYLLANGKPDPSKSLKIENGLMRINYVDKPDTFASYSFVDVYNGTISPDVFDGKIVLVGATAVNLHDNQITSVSYGHPMSGVEIHANAIQTIIQGKYLMDETHATTIAIIWILSFAVCLLMAYVPIIPATIIVCLSVVAYLVYSFVSFDHGTIRNIVFPLLVFATAYITLALYRYFVEYNQRRFLKKAFSLYVSPAILEEIIKNPKNLVLGGSRREMTVLFADIAGFTTISERVPPDELSFMLNSYLTRVSRIIFSYNGVIDKFIGDAVMAFWNAPLDDKKHAINACEAALKVEEEIKIIRKEWEHLDIKHFSVRIGINTGDMVVGNMGSDMRFDYTMLGDNVNLASRLEGINKQYGTFITISQSTYELVKDKVVARFVDTVAVKGKKKGVKIYELRAIGHATRDEKDFLEDFETARSLYEKGDFSNAHTAFLALSEKYPEDGPIQTLLKRCEEYSKNPPADWDGIYHSTSK